MNKKMIYYILIITILCVALNVLFFKDIFQNKTEDDSIKKIGFSPIETWLLHLFSRVDIENKTEVYVLKGLYFSF